MPTDLAVVPEDKRALTVRLWEELADENGQLQPDAITDMYLDRLRQRIERGELPGFITTNYVEGWRIYARSSLQSMFLRYRERVGSVNIRRYYPTMLETRDASAWSDRHIDEQAQVDWANNRMQRTIQTSVWLQGAAVVAAGKATWEDIRATACQHVHTAVDVAVARDEASKEEAS